MSDRKVKYLFSHIPKCAGTSVYWYLVHHKIDFVYYCHKFLMYDQEKYNDHVKFTIVRNPVERFISTYFYTIKRIKERDHEPDIALFNTISNLYDKYGIKDLKTYVEKFPVFYEEIIKPDWGNLEDINTKDNVHSNPNVLFYPQSWFICDKDNDVIVDKILTIDNLESGLISMFGAGGVSNRNKSTKSSDYELTSEDIKMIEEIYHEDFKIYQQAINADN